MLTDSLETVHELDLVQNIIDIIEAELKARNLQRAVSVKLKVGQISHVLPDALRFCFDSLSKGTSLEGAELIINVVPTQGKCRNCGQVFEINDLHPECPACGDIYVEIVSGRELIIEEFEGE